MSRYTGPSWKVSRRLDFSTLENGKELVKRPYAPGQHGQGRRKMSEYGIQLQEKQRVRHMYGLTEKQFRRTFEKAGKIEGIQGDNFLKLLESRLDNIVYRAGFAQTRRQSRQIVNHSHVLVNGKKVNIPSYNCVPGDVISFKEKSQNLKIVTEAIENIASTLPFMESDKNKRQSTFVRLPEISELNQEINMQLIVEFYNR
ncbi:MAG: 30S ribosomal protein S4 [Mycoplasmatales bacterium]